MGRGEEASAADHATGKGHMTRLVQVASGRALRACTRGAAPRLASPRAAKTRGANCRVIRVPLWKPPPRTPSGQPCRRTAMSSSPKIKVPTHRNNLAGRGGLGGGSGRAQCQGERGGDWEGDVCRGLHRHAALGRVDGGGAGRGGPTPGAPQS